MQYTFKIFSSENKLKKIKLILLTIKEVKYNPCNNIKYDCWILLSRLKHPVDHGKSEGNK